MPLLTVHWWVNNMFKKIFSPESPYTKRARSLALAWTLLIFILCLLPAQEIPNVNVPMADKWVHFVMFGLFAFLWLCAYPSRNISFLLLIFAISVATGWFVEFLQGSFPSLGRNRDMMDVVADGIGGFLGVLLFAIPSYMSARGAKQH